jgi:glycosyltransferase involved in cell wall biosynthesis
MRIGLDARYLSHGIVGGINTYLKNLLPALFEAATGHEIILYVDTKRPFELRDLPGHVTVRSLPYRNGLSSAYLDFVGVRRAMARDGVDVAHFPANYGFGPRGPRAVITLHDALNIHPLREIVRGLRDSNAARPRSIAMMAYLHFCTLAALRRAHLLITVSNHARNEIDQYSRFGAERIVAIPHAPSPDLRRVEDPALLADVRLRHDLQCAFVLADALKNPIILVKAWRRLPAALRDRFQIVFFSRRPDPLPIVREAVADGHARLLVRPSREDLIALYSMAEAFLFPSWIEGFGLPVLEAMTCGAPVIASDRGSIPEVAGGAALLADPYDADAFARHIARVLGDPTEAQRLRQLGFARAAQFSWRNAAQRTLDVYRQAFELPALAQSAIGGKRLAMSDEQ